MPKAVWNGKVVAESDVTEMVEGNHYFPPASLNKEMFELTETTSICGWKGTASYYTINVEGERNVDAAWCYADPKPEADNIRGYVAFWKGVTIEETAGQQVNQTDKGGSCDIGER